MLDDFANSETQILASIALFVVVSVTVVVFFALRSIFNARRQERLRNEACAHVDTLAKQLSFADLVISDEDCAEQYKNSLGKCRAQFKDCVEAMNSWLQKNVIDEEQWQSLATTARITTEVVRSNAASAQEFLTRCRIAKTALSAADELVSTYLAPDGLTVDVQPARRQAVAARRLFDEIGRAHV